MLVQRLEIGLPVSGPAGIYMNAGVVERHYDSVDQINLVFNIVLIRYLERLKNKLHIFNKRYIDSIYRYRHTGMDVIK